MMQFVLGAVVFGSGILIGAAIVTSSMNNILNVNDDEKEE